jgi:hypothetical protein
MVSPCWFLLPAPLFGSCFTSVVALVRLLCPLLGVAGLLGAVG